MIENNFKQTEENEKSVIEVVSKRKKCFIITPIGDEKQPIRRHIDGLIDECIIPVLKDKYTVNVAHRITTPGSINNQVIQEIYESELVIANLTKLNPNVMYELAFRHALKKPVIIIMEKDSEYKIPFDLVTERTIFYDNDFQGAIDLKNKLADIVTAIENLDEDDIDNPIYSALAKLKQTENVIRNIKNVNQDDITSFQYIINQLEEVKNEISVKTINNRQKKFPKKSPEVVARVKFSIRTDDIESEHDYREEMEKILDNLVYCGDKYECKVNIINRDTESINVDILCYNDMLDNFISTINTNSNCRASILNRKIFG